MGNNVIVDEVAEGPVTEGQLLFRKELGTALDHPSLRSERARGMMAFHQPERGASTKTRHQQRRMEKSSKRALPKLTLRTFSWTLRRWLFGDASMWCFGGKWLWKSDRYRCSADSKWELLRRLDGKG